MTDEAHERAVGAATTRWCEGMHDVDSPRARLITEQAIGDYLQSLADQGDPCIRVSEVVEALRDEFPGGAMRAHNPIPRNPATFIQRRFAPGPEEHHGS